MRSLLAGSSEAERPILGAGLIHCRARAGPWLQAETTLINFTVTEGGLEDQLLALVVNKERADLEEAKSQLIVQNSEFVIKLQQLEDGLLEKLSTAQGDLTENGGWWRAGGGRQLVPAAAQQACPCLEWRDVNVLSKRASMPAWRPASLLQRRSSCSWRSPRLWQTRSRRRWEGGRGLGAPRAWCLLASLAALLVARSS